MTTELIFPGRIPGNNGPDGLLRMKAKDRTKIKNSFFYHVRSLTRNRHKGPVRFELVRHSIGIAMDYDNLVSTGKILTDAIVKAGVLPDDKMGIIAQRQYSQTKAFNQSAQFTLIRITDLPWEEIVDDPRYEEGPECVDGFPVTTFCG